MTTVFIPVSTGPWITVPPGSTNLPVTSAAGFAVGQPIAGAGIPPNTTIQALDIVKKTITLRYPNYSGTLATGGGLIFLALLDGSVAAYDDTTLEEVWKINVGSGFAAPPMTFEVNGKQYIAIASGPSSAAKSKLINTPELKEQRNAMVLYVFGL